MTIELKFPPSVVETNLDIKGVKVQIKKIDGDSYQIWITDEENRFVQSKLPEEYKYIMINNITLDDTSHAFENYWWSSGYYELTYRSGYFKNGEEINYKQLITILESIENGVNRLEEIYSTPEIIKVGNVIIEKKRIDKDTCLSVDGLVYAYQYPSEITSNGNTVYRVGNDEFTIYDINNDVVDIDYRCYFPIKDFKVSNEDADKIIRIITASEKKLEEYYKEKNRIKVGDTIKFNEIFLGKVMAIDDKCAWLKINDSHNGFYYVTYELAGLIKVRE